MSTAPTGDAADAADAAANANRNATVAGSIPDPKAEMRKGAQSIAVAEPPSKTRGLTSDLSVDEALLIHGAGWEPLDLVCGVAVCSIPYGVWSWASTGGSITLASDAHNLAMGQAVAQIRAECSKVKGHGVVGMEVEVTLRQHHVDVELVGTAVRPMSHHQGDDAALAMPFVTDLSARDFTLLMRAGWMPVGLAFGTSFVYAPRRTAGAAMRQSTQNVELTNYTQAMYAARESAMEQMQSSALQARGQGVVEVKVSEGPVVFARHAIGFSAWGTAVKLVAETHQFVQPQVVLPLDDAVVAFEAESMRSTGQGRH